MKTQADWDREFNVLCDESMQAARDAKKRSEKRFEDMLKLLVKEGAMTEEFADYLRNASGDEILSASGQGKETDDD